MFLLLISFTFCYLKVFNPIPEGSSVMGINCRRPSLKLNLYDTTGEEDIFINQVLVDIGYATFCKDRLGSGSSVEGRWLQ